MSMPKSIVKINKDGVTYTSNIDAANYTIEELSRGALRDVSKVIRRDAKKRAPKYSGNLRRNIATWVKKSKTGEAPELQLGIYDATRAKKKGLRNAFYGMFLELGTKKIKKQPFLKPAVYENINLIREIEAKYLSGIDKVTTGTVFDEGEEIKDD